MQFLVLILLLPVSIGARAADPWQFRGIHLGAKVSEDDIMRALGADKYTKNPEYDPWNNKYGCDTNPNQQICEESDFKKYGLRAVEKEEADIGPSCQERDADNYSCVNPWMATQRNWDDHGHGIRKVGVFVHDGVVFAIDIFFDSVDTDDFFEVAHRQFGETNWKTKHQDMYIGRNENDAQGINVDRVIETKQTKEYRVMMSNYDEIFTHIAGPEYMGILEMKMLDQNF